jgi:hypothetical protein
MEKEKLSAVFCRDKKASAKLLNAFTCLIKPGSFVILVIERRAIENRCLTYRG